MELNQIKEEGTQNVDVDWDEDGEPSAGFIIVSKNSDEYQSTFAAQRQRAIRRQAVKRTRFDMKSEEGAEQLDSTIQQNNAELALAVVTGWYGFTLNGQPAPFDKKQVEETLKLRPSWRDRILQALEDEAAFLKRSPGTSATSQKQAPAAAKEAKTA